jgi:hypothetical protein
VNNCFPLILTFSLREKEQPLLLHLKLARLQSAYRPVLPVNWERFPFSPRERAGRGKNPPGVKARKTN